MECTRSKRCGARGASDGASHLADLGRISAVSRRYLGCISHLADRAVAIAQDERSAAPYRAEVADGSIEEHALVVGSVGEERHAGRYAPVEDDADVVPRAVGEDGSAHFDVCGDPRDIREAHSHTCVYVRAILHF